MATATLGCTVTSTYEVVGKTVVEHGTFEVVENDLGQWATLNYLKYIDTIILQYGKVNTAGVMQVVYKNSKNGSSATNGSVYFLGSGTFTDNDFLEFIAIGRLSY
jgi:hypothetical protein